MDLDSIFRKETKLMEAEQGTRRCEVNAIQSRMPIAVKSGSVIKREIAEAEA